MKARDIMFSSPEVLTPDDTLSAAAKMMNDLDVGALPIVGDKSGMRLVGIVTDRDIVMRHVAEGHTEDCPVRHAMTPRTSELEFVTVRPEDTTDYVMDLMTNHQIRRVPVVSPEDQLVGIIALADVAREIGPRSPADVVRVLQAISEPSKDRTPAPAG
ncbi:MAG: CBS domain-containing protein [Gemmatimonadota bacterium]